MANYTNDMAAVEARPIDLTPGDMVDGSEVREHGARITHWANSPDRDDPTFTVRAVRPGGEGMVILDAGDAGEYLIDAFVDLTVQPVICADCGHNPTDCECED